MSHQISPAGSSGRRSSVDAGIEAQPPWRSSEVYMSRARHDAFMSLFLAAKAISPFPVSSSIPAPQ